VLENMVLIGGTPILGVLAIILYGFSSRALDCPYYDAVFGVSPCRSESVCNREHL